MTGPRFLLGPLARGRRLGAAPVAVFLGILCAAGPLFGLAGATSAPHAASSSAAALAGTTGAVSFASRAGYAPRYVSEAGASVPATGPVPVDVTFRASLSPAAYAEALAYFQGEGLQVRSTDPARLSVGLTGPASRTDAAFSTELQDGTWNGSPVRFPATAPSLPASLEAEVAGVVGLTSGFTSFSFDLQPLAGTAAADGLLDPASAQVVTPAFARQYYAFSQLYNLSGGYQNATYPTRESIAVVLWGEGYAPSDINTFFGNPQYYSAGFPAPRIVPYPVDGAPGPSDNAVFSPDARAVEETTLDIEWAGSMAPGATIDVVYAPDGPPPSYSPSNAALTDALREAISLNVSAITMSFGTADAADNSLESAWAPLLQEAASKGITVLAATGDTGGYVTACSGGPQPQFPAASPAVLAVGGTNLQVSHPLSGTTVTETGWNDSGGGFSTQYGAPSWQEVGSAAAPISANGHRGMPDVSASAADNFLYFNGTTTAAGGTSFASPLWAGLVADIDAKWGQQLGFFTPSLYHVGAEEPTGEIGDGLVDVVGGANCVGSAGPGWDVVTGWGTPRADVLYDDLLGSFVNISLTVDRTTVAPGGSVAVTARLTNRTSGAPIPGVAVSLSLSADTEFGPCTGTFSSASPTTNATGMVSATLSVPFCYLGEHALLNASVATTKLYGTNGMRVDVNLLGLDPALAFLEQPPWAYVTYSVIVGAAAVAGVWIGRPKEPAILSGAPRPLQGASPPSGAVASPPRPPPPIGPPAGPSTPSAPPTPPLPPPSPPSEPAGPSAPPSS